MGTKGKAGLPVMSLVPVTSQGTSQGPDGKPGGMSMLSCWVLTWEVGFSTCHCFSGSSFCVSLSAKGEKLCLLCIGRVSLTCCMLVPEHRWPQGAWQLPPLGNHRKQLCLKSLAWQRAQSNLSCCLSHLSGGSYNENKQLSIMPLQPLGNNESKNKAAK